jgi:hypothetical protein
MWTGEQGEARRLMSLVIKTLALISIYAVYGVLQERIMKGVYYDPSGSNSKSQESTFSSAPFLVLCNRLVSLGTGLLLALVAPKATDSPLPVSADTQFRQRPSRLPSWFGRFKPASPLLYYALVAGLNNAATMSQYTSLSYLSFTTATLGKSAKMVPVLILGYVGYGKKYKRREWIGVGVVVLGIWGYLMSLPTKEMNEAEHKKAVATNWMGLACLVAYLFFDGLTSTTQELVFGKSKSGQSLLLGLTAPVMDQMV